MRLRASRLIGYLATRTARGEFARGDSIALVGHSTGGLDIRLALYTMAEKVANAPPGSPSPGAIVDGPTLVPYADILALVGRVVFLSVPHYGTNVADFAVRYARSIQALAKDAANGLALNHGAVGRVRSKLFALFNGDRSDLVQAIRDALDEGDEKPNDGPERQATEREARFELTAWLDNMANDFSSILDLRSQTAARRDAELSMLWPFDPAVAPDPIDLVDADHGDVIGHFALRKLPAAQGSEGRRYYSYDIFQSSFKLAPQAFAAVWYAVFDFCVRP